MPISSKATAFIESNLEHYREVTLAVKTYEEEVEAALRSIWTEFHQQLAGIGLPDDPTFETNTGDDGSEMYLKTGWSAGIQIGIALQCRNDDDASGGLAVYSWVWVKNADLRKSLDNYVVAHVPAPFVHEFESSTTYITVYLDLGKAPEVIELLRDGFKTLFECLVGSPEFCRCYNISGPISGGSSHR